MDISCRSSMGGDVVTARENLVFYAMVSITAVPLVALLVRKPGPIESFLGSILFILFFSGLAWWLVVPFSAYLLNKSRARLLLATEAPGIFEIVRSESERIGLSPKLAPSSLW